MAPPAQKGKFKPRKPPTRSRAILPGAAMGAPVPPPAPGSSSGRGRGRGGGGRGGRGPRRVIHQGPAFFTANRSTPVATAAAAATSRSGGGASTTFLATSSSSGDGATRSNLLDRVKSRLQQQQQSGTRKSGGSLVKREQSNHAPEEEIVGMLEESIGGDLPERVKSTTSRKLPRTKSGNAKGAAAPEPQENLESLPVAIFEYDSDSSMEVANLPRKTKVPANIVMPSKKPLTLPFPAAQFPPGVGAPMQLGMTTAAKRAQPVLAQELSTEITPGSPFVGLGDVDDLEDENASWFLLQLPTRLPNLPSDEQVPTTDQVDSSFAVSEVSRVPLRNDCFDNSLVRASPGKIGKFVVYESGKTVLVLDGEDGRSCQLDAVEGLSCSFRQQAVLVDKTTKEFIPLGDVGKTIVVTPDIETAFRNSR